MLFIWNINIFTFFSCLYVELQAPQLHINESVSDNYKSYKNYNSSANVCGCLSNVIHKYWKLPCFFLLYNSRLSLHLLAALLSVLDNLILHFAFCFSPGLKSQGTNCFTRSRYLILIFEKRCAAISIVLKQ